MLRAAALLTVAAGAFTLLAALWAWGQFAGFVYTRIAVSQGGELFAGSCSETIVWNAGWGRLPLSDNISLIFKPGGAGLASWGTIVDGRFRALCRGLRVYVNAGEPGYRVETLVSSYMAMGEGSGLVFYVGRVEGYTVSAAIGAIDALSLLESTLLYVVLGIGGYLVLRAGRSANPVVGRDSDVCLLASLTLLSTLVGALFIAVSIVSGDVPLFYLTFDVAAFLVSILLATAILLRAASLNGLSMLSRLAASLAGLLLVLYTAYTVASSGPRMVAMIHSVIALAHASPVELTLIAPAYYPILGILMAAMALTALLEGPKRLSARLCIEDNAALTTVYTTLILLSIWPLARLTALRIALLTALLAATYKAETSRQKQATSKGKGTET